MERVRGVAIIRAFTLPTQPRSESSQPPRSTYYPVNYAPVWNAVLGIERRVECAANQLNEHGKWLRIRTAAGLRRACGKPWWRPPPPRTANIRPLCATNGRSASSTSIWPRRRCVFLGGSAAMYPSYLATWAQFVFPHTTVHKQQQTASIDLWEGTSSSVASAFNNTPIQTPMPSVSANDYGYSCQGEIWEQGPTYVPTGAPAASWHRAWTVCGCSDSGY